MSAPPYQPVRLSVYAAAQEWGVHRETLGKRLKALGVESSDGKFTIGEIDRAVHGDIDAEKLRKTTEEADNLALRNAEKRKQLVDVERFSRGLEKKVAAMKQVVLESGIPEDKQDAILNAIADILISRQ